MNEAFKGTVAALDALQNQLHSIKTDDRLLSETVNFHHPALYPSDFVGVVFMTKEKIIKYGEIELSDSEYEFVSSLPIRINGVGAGVAPYIFNGNGAQAIPAFMTTFAFINMALDDLFSYERLEKSHLIPKAMSRRVKSFEARLNDISPDIEGLDEKIKSINEAHSVAENIPIDMQQLKTYNNEASNLKDGIQKIQFSLEDAEKKSSAQLSALEEKNKKATDYLELCEKAIVASTSKGLAGAFEIKAKNLNHSIIAWVVGLLVALGAGGYIGFERLKVLSKVLETGSPSTAVIITQLVLSIFSVGAPLWFAWISTKQINQRFKLAEDYAFKSAVAKAYEGYKNEAARVSDGDFERRLFDSALSRLEEAPLRLINDDEHSTPWAEMLNSNSFQKFLDASIDNVNFVKGIISKKGQPVSTAKSSDSAQGEAKSADV
ncbi:hypothetical protein [Kluyvera chengduensis]|uniref:hypothetical protein n=1 Tax=Kluyvera sp. 142359 TaxID=3375726 RepID=UPI003772FC27